MAQWRWEFQRRDQDYRKYWDFVQGLIRQGWKTEPELDYHTSDRHLVFASSLAMLLR